MAPACMNYGAGRPTNCNQTLWSSSLCVISIFISIFWDFYEKISLNMIRQISKVEHKNNCRGTLQKNTLKKKEEVEVPYNFFY